MKKMKKSLVSKSEKKKKKQQEKRKKELKDILHWMDIQKITNEGIYLQRDKKEIITRGIRLDPINIYLKEEREKARHIIAVATGLDTAKFPIYYKFIKSTPTVDLQMSQIAQALETQQNAGIKKIMQMQLDKLDWFASTHSEATFMVLVQADEDRIDKKVDIIQKCFTSAGFIVNPLTITNYENIVMEQFENETVNEYLFSVCISNLEQEEEYNSEIDKEG